MQAMRRLILVFGVVAWAYGPSAAAGDDRRENVAQFVAAQFPESTPKRQALWLRGELASDIESILGRPSSRLRVHYWREGARSAWVLDEVGKELPITAGFVVNQGVLERAEVLVYREGRGGEVQYSSFLQQFVGLGRKLLGLSQNIDNISGATLSVGAMKKMATMALRLSEALPSEASPESAADSSQGAS